MAFRSRCCANRRGFARSGPVRGRPRPFHGQRALLLRWVAAAGLGRCRLDDGGDRTYLRLWLRFGSNLNGGFFIGFGDGFCGWVGINFFEREFLTVAVGRGARSLVGFGRRDFRFWVVGLISPRG